MVHYHLHAERNKRRQPRLLVDNAKLHKVARHSELLRQSRQQHLVLALIKRPGRLVMRLVIKSGVSATLLKFQVLARTKN